MFTLYGVHLALPTTLTIYLDKKGKNPNLL